jgi:hypothetical protein
MRFVKGMMEAQQIINKNYQDHKLEMDNSLEDFKKEVIDNRNAFKSNAPFAVDKANEYDNEKSLEKLKEFKLAC